MSTMNMLIHHVHLMCMMYIFDPCIQLSCSSGVFNQHAYLTCIIHESNACIQIKCLFEKWASSGFPITKHARSLAINPGQYIPHKNRDRGEG